MVYFFIIGGFILLLSGAEIVVRGAVGIADKLQISRLIVGMTIIAFGTSAPEFLVTLKAALAGSSALAIGNVVGSNISNILLVTGVAALLMPITLGAEDLRRDGWMLLTGTGLFLVCALRSVIDLPRGIVLLLFFFGFLTYSYLREKHRFVELEGNLQKGSEPVAQNIFKLLIYLILGFAALIYGAEILVKGGVRVARIHGVSEAVIGLTVMAIGTSLPELVTSVVAAIRKHSDVALGNIVGSNVINVVGIVGVVSIVTPLSVPSRVINFDGWVMLAATLLLMPYMIGSRLEIGRFQALLFLFAYIVYIFSISFGINTIKIG